MQYFGELLLLFNQMEGVGLNWKVKAGLLVFAPFTQLRPRCGTRNRNSAEMFPPLHTSQLLQSTARFASKGHPGLLQTWPSVFLSETKPEQSHQAPLACPAPSDSSLACPPSRSRRCHLCLFAKCKLDF